jgi:hypothetical protein
VICRRVPSDQSEILHSWIIPTVGHELLEQWFCLVDEVRYYVDMGDDQTSPKLSLRAGVPVRNATTINASAQRDVRIGSSP